PVKAMVKLLDTAMAQLSLNSDEPDTQLGQAPLSPPAEAEESLGHPVTLIQDTLNASQRSRISYLVSSDPLPPEALLDPPILVPVPSLPLSSPKRFRILRDISEEEKDDLIITL
ncbi:9056_t:CDS:1, partial [Acaulospora colombiana]